MQAQILAPAATLIAWSLVMLIWVAATRFTAMKAMHGGSGGLAKAPPSGRGQDLEGRLPDRVNWKAHNYTHLMEQPTLFYAVVVILAIMGAGTVDVLFAWLYVGLRIVHSVYQATVNVVKIRFAIFALSTLALTVLAIRALTLTLLHGS